LQQVALGSDDKNRLARLWTELLGVPRTGNFRSESENVDEDILTLGTGSGRVEIDLMQPIDPDGRPRVSAPALHHIGLWIDDLPAAYAWLSAEGVHFAPGGIRIGAAGHAVCFIHPKASAEKAQGGEGVLIELVQAPKELIEGLSAGPHG
jgi:lactoylglutathione lyase